MVTEETQTALQDEGKPLDVERHHLVQATPQWQLLHLRLVSALLLQSQ